MEKAFVSNLLANFEKSGYMPLSFDKNGNVLHSLEICPIWGLCIYKSVPDGRQKLKTVPKKYKSLYDAINKAYKIEKINGFWELVN